MLDRTATIDTFLTATAAKQPTPGGGSVAALAGALSAAIGQMVLSYSVDKKDLAAHRPALIQAVTEFEHARAVLLELMVEDQQAYGELTTVRKLPDDSPEKKDRLPAILLGCVRGPQAVIASAVAILKLCDRVVDIVNPWLLSDLAVCAELAMATARAGDCNVRVNLPSVADESDRKKLADETDESMKHALSLVQKTVPRIWGRIGG